MTARELAYGLVGTVAFVLIAVLLNVAMGAVR
jgi:hypothetical protein